MHTPSATTHTEHHWRTGARGIHFCRALTICNNNFDARHTGTPRFKIETLGFCIAEMVEDELLLAYRYSLYIFIVDRVQ